jgi:drug/metabolite transporter (DMT)-like permease
MLEATLLALASSIGLGAADFVGGLGSQRTALFAVTLTSLWTAAGTILAVCLAARPHMSASGAGWAAGSGVMTAVAVPLLYRALAVGPMSLVAPITASYVVLPAAVGVARGALVQPASGGGLILTFAGILIVARAVPPPGRSVRVNRNGLMLSLGAAVTIGGATALLQAAASAPGASPLGAALMEAFAAALTASVFYLVVLRGRSEQFQVSRLAIAAGCLSGCGIALLALASRSPDATTIVAVLTALYSVWVILLARVLLSERLSQFQVMGVLFALTGVVIVSMV